MGRPSLLCVCGHRLDGHDDGQHARYNRTVPGAFSSKVHHHDPARNDRCYSTVLASPPKGGTDNPVSHRRHCSFVSPQPAQPVININVGCTRAGLVFITCPAMTQSDIYQLGRYKKDNNKNSFRFFCWPTTKEDNYAGQEKTRIEKRPFFL